MRRTLTSVLLLTCLITGPLATGQSVEPDNHVLELDGASAWLELPPHILDELDSATVEAWVRLMNPPDRQWARFFAYGSFRHDAGLQVEPDRRIAMFQLVLNFHGFNHLASPQVCFNY